MRTLIVFDNDESILDIHELDEDTSAEEAASSGRHILAIEQRAKSVQIVDDEFDEDGLLISSTVKTILERDKDGDAYSGSDSF